jgi:hypothetical protein
MGVFHGGSPFRMLHIPVLTIADDANLRNSGGTQGLICHLEASYNQLQRLHAGDRSRPEWWRVDDGWDLVTRF